MTDILYKYRSMASRTGAERAMDILVNNQLYAAAPETFDDLFECRSTMNFDAPKEAKIAGAQRQYPGLDATELLNKCAELESKDHSPILDRFRAGMGAICLFTRPDDLLMWAYYGGGHNGICIELRATKTHDQIDFIAKAFHARYCRDFPVVNFYTDEQTVKLEKYLLSKSEAWQHEDEWRVLINEPPENRLIPLPRGMISAVYLGARISDANRQKVLDWRDNNEAAADVDLYELHPAKAAYKLEPKQI